jgi:hypothetical protein
VWVAAPRQQQQQQQRELVDTPSPEPNSTAESAACAATAAGCEAKDVSAKASSAAAGQAAQFATALMLDDGAVPLRSFQSFVRRDSSHHFFSRRLAVQLGAWQRYYVLIIGCAVHATCHTIVVTAGSSN